MATLIYQGRPVALEIGVATNKTSGETGICGMRGEEIVFSIDFPEAEAVALAAEFLRRAGHPLADELMPTHAYDGS